MSAACTHGCLQKFQHATLDFSKTKVPTICKVLPLYKTIQKHLEDAILDPDLENDSYGLKGALEAGLAKIDLHLGKALVGHYPLLGAGTLF
jgi:hypothetical protein